MAFHGVRLRKSNTTMAVSGTYYRVAHQVEEYDTDGFYTGGLDRFVVPAGLAGYYWIKAAGAIASVAVGVLAVGLRVNGTPVAEANIVLWTPIVAPECQRVLYLEVGDIVEVWATQTSGVSRSFDNGDPNNFFEMYRVGV